MQAKQLQAAAALNPETAEALVCAALRGEKPEWPFSAHTTQPATFIDFCIDHGVQVLLHLKAPGLPWPAGVLDSLRTQAIGWAIREQRHLDVLRQALAVLATHGIEPVIFKGTALAYGFYGEAFMRPRADTDVIVPPSQRALASRILESEGFTRHGSVASEFVSYEASFKRADGPFMHTIDLHWRVHYSQFESSRISYEVLRAKAQPLPRLSAAALRVYPPHAVILSCLHRANDMSFPLWAGDSPAWGSDRLIWIYDLHCLLQHMSAMEIGELGKEAALVGMKSVCREPIEMAAKKFGTAVPAELIQALADPHAKDSVQSYLASSPLRQKWADFNSVEGVRRKCTFLAHHLAPPADYIFERFPDLPHAGAGLLQIRRLVHGLSRWKRLRQHRPETTRQTYD